MKEKENFLIRWAKAAYAPALAAGAPRALGGGAAGGASPLPASLLLFARLGQEFVPTLDEQDIAMQAMRIPSTEPDAVDARCSCDVETDASRTFPEVAFVYSKTGTAEMAVRPDAAERLRHVHHPQAPRPVAQRVELDS